MSKRHEFAEQIVQCEQMVGQLVMLLGISRGGSCIWGFHQDSGESQ